MFKPVGDERVVDGLRPSSESDSENVVQRGTSSMRLRVDREGASVTANVELPDHLDNFKLETRDIGSDGLGAQESCCETTMLAPRTIYGQGMYNSWD